MLLIKEEIKKIFKRRIIFLIVLLLSLLNIYNITHNFKDQHSDAYWSIYQEIRGAFSEDKIDFLMSHYNEYKNVIANGIYETEVSNPKYYTGYVYGDFYEFNIHKEEMERIYSYNDTMKKTRDAAKENLHIYEQKNNRYELERNKQISKIYKNRDINSYYDTTGIENYFSYDFSSLLVIMVIMFAASPVFTSEKQVGMNAIIQTCKKGLNKTFFAKKIAMLIFSVIICLYFYILDFICFFSVAHLDGFLAPLYQIKQYVFTPLNISIAEFCVLSIVIKIIGSCIFSLIYMYISAHFSEILFSFSINAGITMLLIVFSSSKWNILNPVSFLSHSNFFNSFVTTNIFGHPIQQYILLFSFGILEFLTLYSTIHEKKKPNNVFYRKKP